MEKQNLPWKDPAVQFHLERQRCVISAQKLNIQVLNRGNTPSEMSQVILAKSGVSVTSPFHTSGREYYLPFHNTDCKQTSGKLPQLNPNQFLDLLKHFHKQIFFYFWTCKDYQLRILLIPIGILRCQDVWEWITLDRQVVVSLNPII